jgi:2-amino-4-hydroxy-6-hydroxymethyldihydropteridine diphosphokinase
MHQAFLLLGSNLGDQKINLDDAAKHLLSRVGKIIKRSSVYLTEPWGFSHCNYFLNQVLILETELNPEQLLLENLSIEKEMGRERLSENYTARIIDIDILFFDELVVNLPNLKIPHPHLHKRKFTLVPLEEIAPDLIHPVLMLSCSNLLNKCTDASNIVLYQ